MMDFWLLSSYRVETTSNPPFGARLKIDLMPLAPQEMPISKASHCSLPILDNNCEMEVKLALGPFNRRAPGSKFASSVCLRSSNGWRTLDFPELFAPARIVSGATVMDTSRARDLKPFTLIRVMPFGPSLSVAIEIMLTKLLLLPTLFVCRLRTH